MKNIKNTQVIFDLSPFSKDNVSFLNEQVSKKNKNYLK